VDTTHSEPRSDDGSLDAAHAPAAVPAVLAYEKPGDETGLDAYVLEGPPRRHVLLPLALVCAGSAMLYGGLAWRVGVGPEFARVAPRHALDVLVCIVASLLTCVACAKLLDVSFGLLTPAISKIAALVVLPMGLASCLAALTGGGGGGMFALWTLAAGLPLQWLLFFSMFRLDMQEATLCCTWLTLARLISFIACRPF
jgi:hypothetical protein